MKTPRRKRRGIRCHAGPDPASSLDFWIPAFAGMTIRREPRRIKTLVIKKCFQMKGCYSDFWILYSEFFALYRDSQKANSLSQPEVAPTCVYQTTSLLDMYIFS